MSEPYLHTDRTNPRAWNRQAWETYTAMMVGITVPLIDSHATLARTVAGETRRALILKSAHPDLSARIRAAIIHRRGELPAP